MEVKSLLDSDGDQTVATPDTRETKDGVDKKGCCSARWLSAIHELLTQAKTARGALATAEWIVYSPNKVLFDRVKHFLRSATPEWSLSGSVLPTVDHQLDIKAIQKAIEGHRRLTNEFVVHTVVWSPPRVYTRAETAKRTADYLRAMGEAGGTFNVALVEADGEDDLVAEMEMDEDQEGGMNQLLSKEIETGPVAVAVAASTVAVAVWFAPPKETERFKRPSSLAWLTRLCCLDFWKSCCCCCCCRRCCRSGSTELDL